MNYVSDVCAADFLPEMWESSTQLLPAAETERFTCADWCDLPSDIGRFDAVLGDKALDNVHPDLWRRFFTSLERMMTPRAVLLLHVGLRDETLDTSFDPVERFFRWVMAVEAGDCGLDDAASGYWEDLLTASFLRSDDATLSIAYWSPDLDRLRVELPHSSQGLATALFERFYLQFGGVIDDRWADCTLERIRAALPPQLNLVGSASADDYRAASLQPILEIRKVS